MLMENLVQKSFMRSGARLGPKVCLLMAATFLWPSELIAQSAQCINSRGEVVGEGSRDGSFICKSGRWVYTPY